MIYTIIGLAVLVILLVVRNKNKKSQGNGKKDISAYTPLPTPPKPPKGTI